MNPERFHLTLAADGRPMMHGWWADRATADLKFREWIGERGSMPGARIVLVDEEAGETLAEWSEEERPGVVGGGS